MYSPEIFVENSIGSVCWQEDMSLLCSHILKVYRHPLQMSYILGDRSQVNSLDGILHMLWPRRTLFILLHSNTTLAL